MRRPVRTIIEVLEARAAFDLRDAEEIIKQVRLPIRRAEHKVPEHLLPEFAENAEAAALLWALNNAAFDFRHSERQQTWPNHSEIAQKAERIVVLCEKLNAEMLDEDGEVHEGLGPGCLYAQAALEGADSGAAAVELALTSVASLQRWAERASNRHRALSVDTGGAGRKAERAWNELVARLAGVYQHLWERRPGVRTNPADNTPDGPFFRFIKAVADNLLPGVKSDQAIRTAIKRYAGGRGA